MKKIFSVSFVIFIFISCLTDIKETPIDILQIDLNKTIIHIKDSLIDTINQTRTPRIEIEKSYIFEFKIGDYMYAYGDLMKVNDNELLVVTTRAKELHDFKVSNLAISSSYDDGKSWTEPQEITHNNLKEHLMLSHPSLVKLNDFGHLMLFFLVKYSVESIDIMYKESFDYGKTWGDDKIVFDKNQGYQILNNNRVIYENGRIIIPLSIPSNKDGIYRNYEELSVFYYYSDDLGITWVKSPKLESTYSLLEPGIVPLSSSEYLMNIRTNKGRILFARTRNKGLNWTFEPSSIKSPSSPQKIIKIPNSKDLLMIWNFTDQNYTATTGNRNPLSLAMSHDNGYNWNYLFDIEKYNPEIDKIKYNYSYPSIYIDNEKTIYITYFEIYSGSSLKLAKIKNLIN